jgi:hypothetical protein
MKIGAAWPHGIGAGFNIQLDVLPLGISADIA